MRDLTYQLKQLCQRNRDGSYSTQVNRARMLNQMADQLHELGYRRMTPNSLKPKHVEALVKRWLAENLAAGTLKNRMNCLRWWADKVDRRNVVARRNEHYGIPDRQFVSNQSKAVTLHDEALARVADQHVRLSLELQRAFGLRREEAIKFIAAYADQGNRIRLKASWTKGGKGRDIPIVTAAQRAVLDAVRWLLRDSGYRLAEQPVLTADAHAMLQLPLPAVHRQVDVRVTGGAGRAKRRALRRTHPRSGSCLWSYLAATSGWRECQLQRNLQRIMSASRWRGMGSAASA
jgi:hypothetical protein